MTTPASAVRLYLDHLLVERGTAENTLASYRRDLNRYLEHLDTAGVTDLAEVTERHVGDFLVGLRTGAGGRVPLATASATRAVVAVRGLHRFALAEAIGAVDVAREVHLPSPPRRLPKALDVTTVDRLLTARGGDADDLGGVRDRALLELLYGTGARISEAVGLDVDDVDAAERS
ncbi:MAG: Site-specific tyrosine recombinase XerD, partial [uncultured Actinomycetospora sp.]